MRTLLAYLALVLAIGMPSAAGAAAGPQSILPATKVIVFHPAGATGAPVKGNCWTESIALERSDAWRCMVGNRIYDPCFSAAPRAKTVICAADPTHPKGMMLALASALPTHSPSTSARPWSLLLGDGSYCSAVTGATGQFMGQDETYYCTNQVSVLGAPYAQGKVWYATLVKMNKRYQPVGMFAESIKALYR